MSAFQDVPWFCATRRCSVYFFPWKKATPNVLSLAHSKKKIGCEKLSKINALCCSLWEISAEHVNVRHKQLKKNQRQFWLNLERIFITGCQHRPKIDNVIDKSITQSTISVNIFHGLDSIQLQFKCIIFHIFFCITQYMDSFRLTWWIDVNGGTIFKSTTIWTNTNVFLLVVFLFGYWKLLSRSKVMRNLHHKQNSIEFFSQR